MIDLNHIEKFNIDTLHGVHLQNPIPKDLYDALYARGVLPKTDLVPGKYYLGKCRNAAVAMWDGDVFWYNRYKFGTTYAEKINHLEDDNGYDLFIPLEEVDPTPEQTIDPF